MLGGVTGYDTVETTDESPERVAVIQRLTWAFLCSTLAADDDATWSKAEAAFAGRTEAGRLDSK